MYTNLLYANLLSETGLLNAAFGRAGPGEATGTLLWRAANRWQRDVRAALAPHGLTLPQFLLLAGLARFERGGERPTQRRLAQSCGVDPAVASQTLRQLQDSGFVRREVGADARARELRLTPAGRVRAAAAEPDVAAVDDAFFALLGGNRAAFAGALMALIGLKPRIAARRAVAG
jgi:DNA-binding MarR family transcriptional regulator